MLVLFDEYEKNPEYPSVPPDTEKIQVNDTVSKMAFFYERIRNAIDFKEEHLFRRNAIERILKRRLLLEHRSDVLSRALLHELIRARYLENNSLPETRIQEVAYLLDKYIMFFQMARQEQRWDMAQSLSGWMLQIASAEIDDYLVPHIKSNALMHYAEQVLAPHVNFESNRVAPEHIQPLIRVAIHKTLLKSDPATIAYTLMRELVPAWFSDPSPAVVKTMLNHAPRIREGLEAIQHHVLLEPLNRQFRRYTILFLTIRDLIDEHSADARERLAQPELLTEDVNEVTKVRYKNLQSRLARITTRSVIYLLLTKFVLALLLELPYDHFVEGRIRYVPLAINLVFHPILLFLLAITIHIPIQKNTDRILRWLTGMIYEPQDRTLFQSLRRPIKTSRLKAFYVVVYFLTFVLSYGLLTELLRRFGFNVLGMSLFLLFISLVSFFGFSIRARARDVMVLDERENALTLLLDFFSIPVLAVGRWISQRAPRVNILILFMDFLVEAPYKSLVQVVEDWVSFQKERKEELL